MVTMVNLVHCILSGMDVLLFLLVVKSPSQSDVIIVYSFRVVVRVNGRRMGGWGIMVVRF